jgi:oligopeptide transport system permease protein
MSLRKLWTLLAACCLALCVSWAFTAPEHLPPMNLPLALALPGELPPFGADERGRSLYAYVTQGARVIAVPAVVAGALVSFMAVLGGLLTCLGSAKVNGWIQAASEVVGALPRMVVVLVVALVLPQESRGLMPLAIAWALLASPGAMDEAGSVAERLGGARFVEALRAHGYTAVRIFGIHVVWHNLRPVVVRQGAEVTMQVVFLEIALSYLALAENYPSFTHGDNLRSWADLLKLGYPSLIFDVGTLHALILGLGLVGLVALMAQAIGQAAKAR